MQFDWVKFQIRRVFKVLLEEVSLSRSESPRDLRKVLNDEMSVFESETPLKSANSDVAIRLNSVAEAINYK